MASNRAKNANVEMSVIPQDADSRPTVVKPGSDAPIAWASPFAERSYAVKVIVGGTEHLISDLRRRFEHTMAHQKVILSVSRVGENTIIALDDTYSVVDAIIERGVSDSSIQLPGYVFFFVSTACNKNTMLMTLGGVMARTVFGHCTIGRADMRGFVRHISVRHSL